MKEKEFVWGGEYRGGCVGDLIIRWCITSYELNMEERESRASRDNVITDNKSVRPTRVHIPPIIGFPRICLFAWVLLVRNKKVRVESFQVPTSHQGGKRLA